MLLWLYNFNKQLYILIMKFKCIVNVNFPLKFKLGLNSIFNLLLKTTHEFLLLVLQWKVNTEKHPQHHINIDIVFWVWKPPD